MPIDRKKKAGNLNKVTKSVKPMKTERTHEENQERYVYIASIVPSPVQFTDIV